LPHPGKEGVLQKRSIVFVRFSCAAIALAVAICVPAIADEPANAPLSIYGNTSTIELAPVLLATSGIYAGPTTLTNGGVAALYADPSSPTSGPGKADIATNAETQVLRASITHPDLRIIFSDTESIYRLIGRRSAGIGAVADLRGKRIGTVGGSSSAYYLHRLLATAGMTEADVTVVPFDAPKQISQAFMAKTVDAMTIWEPEIDIAQRALGADAIEIQPPGIYREIVGMNATSETLADPAKRKVIVAFVRSLIAAAKQINTNPAKAQQLVAQRSGYDVAVVAHAWHHHRFPGTLVSDLLDVMVPEEQWLAAADKRTPRTREQLATLIDRSVLGEAQGTR
jgi:sulfonate transport system substrate-binding protein